MEKRIHNRVMSRAFPFVVFSAATWLFCLPVALAHMTGTDKGETHQSLEGNRAVLGKVHAVTSGQIKVDIGEVQPRFLPLKEAQEKGFSRITEGENLIIVLNAENLIVDFHPLDTSAADHKVIRGEISQNLPIGQESVVIKSDGREQSFPIRSQARSKVSAIPVGIGAVFLIDETNQIADATFVNLNATKQAHQQPERKSPIKGAHSKVDGTIVSPLQANHITIKTDSGSEQPFEVRETLHQKMAGLQKGDAVILMVDKDNKVIDLAVPPAAR
jgi:hypothetical protein